MNKCALLKYRGHPGLNQGPVDLQSNTTLPLSYIPLLKYRGHPGEPGTCRA